MAIDSLSPLPVKVPHAVHHDLEALLYVMIWTCSTQSGPNNRKRQFNYRASEIYMWNAGDGMKKSSRSIWDAKGNVMKDRSNFINLILVNIDNYFAPLKEYLLRLRDIIFGVSTEVLEDARKAIGKPVHASALVPAHKHNPQNVLADASRTLSKSSGNWLLLFHTI